jgi:predicted nucleic acid-binding protein
MKILVDTNILLDVLTQRRPFFKDAAMVWSLIHDGLLDGFVSAISVNNLYYIVRKLRDRETAESFVDDLLRDFGIVSLTKNILQQSRTVAGKDFEDSIQYFSAIQEGCEFLLTRNKKDFPTAGVQILNPTEFLDQLRDSER